MPDKSKQFPDGDPGTERLVSLQLLRKEHPERWTRAELLCELYDVDEDAITGSLGHLERLGLVVLDGEHVQASEGLRHLDTLGLVCI